MVFNKLLALAVMAALAGSSCAIMQPSVTKVEHVVDCAEPAIASQLPAIASEAATDLLSQDYDKALTDILRRVGSDVLVCAVKSNLDAANARMAAGTGTQSSAVVRAHAQDYLHRVDARFAAVGP